MHMPYRLISPLIYLARVRVLAAAVAMGVAVANANPGVSAADASAPPAFIHQALPGQFGKQAVDAGRAAVGNRVADDAVTVCGWHGAIE